VPTPARCRCGKPEHPSHDAQATTNPSVIVEVLSPSSAGDDDGDNRRDFQSLAPLQAYVLAAQDARSGCSHGAENPHWRRQRASACGTGGRRVMAV
jgi:Uma2 family endonuclease